MTPEPRPPLPPFTLETARQKVRMAENAWNSRDPARVALAYTADSVWRNRSEFLQGREAIVAFLASKWAHEHEYRLMKDLWAFHEHRIAVRFQYEWHDGAGQWWRSYGNEQWEFDATGLMRRREASINDVMIDAAKRRFLWPLGERPDADEMLDYPSHKCYDIIITFHTLVGQRCSTHPSFMYVWVAILPPQMKINRKKQAGVDDERTK